MRFDPRSVSPQALAATAFRLRELGIFVALAATILIFSVRADNFLTVGNWQNIATDVAMVGVVAVGQTMVVLTRNIDLSVGSIVGLSAYVSANTLASHHDMPIILVALLAMAVGLACGIGNGILVVVGRIPAIIATLATLAIYRGLAFEATGGGGDNISAFQLPDNFLDLAARKPLGVPVLAWIALAVAVVGAATLRWAPWGRDLYAIGSNPEAARLAGIRVGRRVMTAFAISGALAGLGGFMFAARFASVDAVPAAKAITAEATNPKRAEWVTHRHRFFVEGTSYSSLVMWLTCSSMAERSRSAAAATPRRRGWRGGASRRGASYRARTVMGSLRGRGRARARRGGPIRTIRYHRIPAILPDAADLSRRRE